MKLQTDYATMMENPVLWSSASLLTSWFCYNRGWTWAWGPSIQACYIVTIGSGMPPDFFYQLGSQHLVIPLLRINDSSSITTASGTTVQVLVSSSIQQESLASQVEPYESCIRASTNPANQFPADIQDTFFLKFHKIFYVTSHTISKCRWSL